MREAMRRIYQRKVKATDLQDKVVEDTLHTLFTGVEDGAGTGYDYTSPDIRMIQRMRTNLLTFAAFKNYNQQAEMIKALVDDNGKIRPFHKWKKEVDRLGEKYHRHWLNTEYNTVLSSAEMARQWDEYDRLKDLYPYLVYKSQDDEKVRNAHRMLHDVAKPIDDPFWDTYYPPNGWNCRCYILQASSTDGHKTEPDGLPDPDQMPPAFRHNPGKTHKAFTEDHPFFTVAPELRDKIMLERNRIYRNADFYDRIDGISVHVTNYVSQSMTQELSMAQRLMAEGLRDIKMLPEIEDKGIKIPDFIIGNKMVAEYKKLSTRNIKRIEERFREARNQILGSRYADLSSIIILEIGKGIDLNRLFGKLLAHSGVEEVWLIQNSVIHKRLKDK